MARNGSGTYALPAGNPVVTGTTVSSTTHNATMSDIADALTASLAKDGQTAATADLPMGGFKHTNIGNGSARSHYPSIAQIQDGPLTLVGSVAGTANAVTGNLAPAAAAYVAGLQIVLIPTATNTAAATLNLNSLGVKNILPAVGGVLVSGVPVILIYDGTQFVAASYLQTSGSFTATLVGCTTSPTATVSWVRSGHLVTLYLESSLTGTSNSTGISLTGLPSTLYPARNQLVAFPIGTEDNGSGMIYGCMLNINSGGSVTASILKSLASGYVNNGWTSSGQKGLAAGLTVTYSLQ